MKPNLLARGLVCGVLFSLAASSSWGEDAPAFKRTSNIQYGRKSGLALTLDLYQPANPNGIGIIWIGSAGWLSGPGLVDADNPLTPIHVLTDRGYTVAAIVHGSQPKFNIPEIIQDVHRAVRFVRAHAEDYGIDPNRIGICGASAGGHLSLMQATAGNAGNPKAEDPIDRVSSRVQAVACHYPPTDFLNYGAPGEIALGNGRLKDFQAPFEFEKFIPIKAFIGRYELITNEEERQKIGREISPANHVSDDDPPALIVHGDQDELVPLQQAELIAEKLKAAGIPAEIVVREGKAHGWPNQAVDYVLYADWFDKHLLNQEP